MVRRRRLGMARPSVCGGDEPQVPFPVYLRGNVERGFGRGSKQLNCATANLPVQAIDDPVNDAEHQLAETGVYFGYAQVHFHDASQRRDDELHVHPMVMSVGRNPHFQAEHKTLEVHILHPYTADFYGEHMRVIVLGYIRAQRKYESLDALIQDIELDKRVGEQSLRRPAYEAYRRHTWFAP